MGLANLNYIDLMREFELIDKDKSEFKNEVCSKPFSIDSVNEILKNGYKLKFQNFESGGFCNFEKKLIRISDKIEYFERDDNICHEVVHAFYGFVSWDVYMDLDGCRNNKIITELLARRIRAVPEYLASILDGFKIPSHIYDKSSLLASQLRNEIQLYFPFVEKIFHFTIMDFSKEKNHSGIEEYF